jgi:formylglycine-generating enzyme required for sulfatase activity
VIIKILKIFFLDKIFIRKAIEYFHNNIESIKMNQKIIIVVLLLTFSLNLTLVFASNRTALVIGNSSYKSSPLKNHSNDAKDIADKLKKLGFDVVLRTDADKRSMVDGINLFAKKLARSEVGIFYFAGHGIQINNINYLIPVNSKVESESDVEFEGINAGRILGKMKEAGNRLNIVVLDACRNNPFARSFRSSAKGLAKMDAPPGSIIAYATSPGFLAEDGTGRNGVYTGELLKNLENPDLAVQEVFNQTGLDVMKQTNNKQVPWVSSTPVPKYFLAQRLGLSAPTIQGQSWTDPVTGMEFVWVPAGCYQMGSSSGEADGKPVHEVCLDGFWMAKTEVSNRQYRQFKSDHNSKDYKGVNLNGDNQPAVNVSWEDAKAYAKWLSQKTGQKMVLPAKAQWEYAARAGTKTIWYWGNEPDDACRYANVPDDTSKKKFSGFYWKKHNCNDGYAGTAPVASFVPNNFGLYDMLGNVWEWCEDVYDNNASSKHGHNNSVVTSGSNSHVACGGGWNNDLWLVRYGNRYGDSGVYRDSDIGFRLCLSRVRQ